MLRRSGLSSIGLALFFCAAVTKADADDAEFFERRIRPILVKHCYECHSEEAKEQQGGLLLDRRAGWIEGGDTDKAVLPGEPDASLLIKAVRSNDDDLQMPPEKQLAAEQVGLLEEWVRRGAPGPKDDIGDTEFSRLGDQEYLFAKAEQHWAFQPVATPEPPQAANPAWNEAIDRFVFEALAKSKLTASRPAEAPTLIRRLTYDLTGLQPTPEEVAIFEHETTRDPQSAFRNLVDRLLDSPAFGEHFGRMWLDIARYADTDSFYRPDTRTPHYFPFAFTYRDYVIDAFNNDKPYNQFVCEQLAADLMGFDSDAPEMAALGFLTVGPHANRNPTEALDDWIDLTTRGLMGLTAACARCHDHKYEPIPTADYYSLHGVFASIVRVHPLDEAKLPILPGYEPRDEDRADYEKKRAAIDAKIKKAGGKKAGNNNRSVAQKIRETELAELLLFHPGGPTHTMIVAERARPLEPVVFVRGDPASRGDNVPRRFLKILDSGQEPFPGDSSGRLQLAEKIVDPDNPLTARVFVNRVWGVLIGSYLVDTPSDFGLQGSRPTHPELLDWLAADFVAQGWSVKRLVQTIVLSQTYQQRSDHREDMAAIDPENRQLWRANRKRLSIESLRDSLLAVSGQLDCALHGRPAELWGDNYTRRRSIYGYINRFNLDPTLRAFDFPTPMQTQPGRDESIVAPQALFTMNAPFVIDQAIAITELDRFTACETDAERAASLFEIVFQRDAATQEIIRLTRFVELQQRFFTKPRRNSRITSPWPLVAQSLLMSNEFQYVD
jgi:hypothetical protein